MSSVGKEQKATGRGHEGAGPSVTIRKINEQGENHRETEKLAGWLSDLPGNSECGDDHRM